MTQSDAQHCLDETGNPEVVGDINSALDTTWVSSYRRGETHWLPASVYVNHSEER
jgi:hypothetical protein